MDLSHFDGKRIAIVMQFANVHRVIRGLASYVNLADSTNIMRIAPEEPSPGNPEFVIDEQKWDGHIVPDDRYGCDFQLELNG